MTSFEFSENPTYALFKASYIRAEQLRRIRGQRICPSPTTLDLDAELEP